MEVLFIILNELDYLDDILTTLIKLEIKGATILDSQGLAQAIIKNGLGNIFNTGIFAKDLEDSNPHNKTIMSVMAKEKTPVVVNAIRELLDEVEHIGAGFMFSVPVGNVYPLQNKGEKK